MTTVSKSVAQADIADFYADVRAETVRLTEPLATEDMVVQSMTDASPTKWHLGHVTWFFETFVLKPHASGYQVFKEEFDYIYNSYYNAVGRQFPRPRRGMLTRPDMRETLEYRQHADRGMQELFGKELPDELLDVSVLGLHHEQQHQELILMDIKNVLFQNPRYPAYSENLATRRGAMPPMKWVGFEAGVRDIGFDGQSSEDKGFAYDNESPRHPEWVDSFELASRLVTNAEYLAFIQDGGYQRPEFWLSDGWTAVQKENWRGPLYWVERDGVWHEFTLGGLKLLDPDAPVCHVSLFEADAYATWACARLPREAEWEIAAAGLCVDGPIVGHFADRGIYQPTAAAGAQGLEQMFGDTWEWTQSAYSPYPGYKPARGAMGEYNSKFMCNQYVVRGGCCVTPAGHTRVTYRNYFYPHMRWQFGGIRLAR
jgi:ergothioneine biosynthesis protein EgtB